MAQHIQEKHAIRCIEKITKLELGVTELKKEKKQLCIVIEDQKQTIGRFEDRLRAVERFIISGVDMPDIVEADGAVLPGKGAKLQPLTQLGSPPFGGSNGKASGLPEPCRGG